MTQIHKGEKNGSNSQKTRNLHWKKNINHG